MKIWHKATEQQWDDFVRLVTDMLVWAGYGDFLIVTQRGVSQKKYQKLLEAGVSFQQIDPIENDDIITIQVNWPYKHAVLVVSEQLVLSDESTQVRSISHEIAHLFLSPMRTAMRMWATANGQDGDNLVETVAFMEERVATDLVNLIVEAYDATQH